MCADLPKVYQRKMNIMLFDDYLTEEPLPYENKLIASLSEDEVFRLKQAHAALQYIPLFAE